MPGRPCGPADSYQSAAEQDDSVLAASADLLDSPTQEMEEDDIIYTKDVYKVPICPRGNLLYKQIYLIAKLVN